MAEDLPTSQSGAGYTAFVRYLGLDVGDKRIGLALSDETATIATGLETLPRKGREDAAAVASLAAEHEVSEIVVGLPRTLEGELGPQAGKVIAFMDSLRSRVPIPVVSWDERLTSKAAERALRESDLSSKRRRGKVDKVAAVLILQSYLDYKKIPERV
jgi:putative Holliday junction resolvase